MIPALVPIIEQIKLRKSDNQQDYLLLFSVIGIFIIGLLVLASASYVSDGINKLIRQLIFGIIGICGAVFFSYYDYRILDKFRRPFYFWTIIALIGIMFVPEINGAHSWLKLGPISLQPSEFAKFTMIIAFASLMSRFKNQINKIPRLIHSLIYFGIPIILILLQPDMGTASIMCLICLVMLIIAGIRWWILGSMVGAVVLVFVVAWNTNIIRPYQKERLNFISAESKGGGYHQKQAKIAIGSGGFLGKGPFHSTQAQRGFLPEQDTDFIFAVLGEEYGFIGCIIVIGLYSVMLWRALRMTEEADTIFGRLVAGGISTMLAGHILINISMNLTLSPVTGIPLPFISYGGSNLLTNLLLIGVLLNISKHCQPRRQWAADETLIKTI